MGYLIITAMSLIAIAASTLFVIQLYAAIQSQSPPHLLGKIMAAVMAVSGCCQPLGQTLYRILFDLFENISWAVLAGSAILALIILSLFKKDVYKSGRKQINLEIILKSPRKNTFSS